MRDDRVSTAYQLETVWGRIPTLIVLSHTTVKLIAKRQLQ